MATKEQERKALAKIQKIVDELGEESYIGTAFVGCWRIAEDNIENDWWCSLNDELATAQRKLSDCWGTIEHLEDKIASLDEDRKKLYSELDLQKHWVTSLTDQRDELVTENKKLESIAGLRQEIIEDRNLEIIQLKAQLYDMIKKGESK